MYGALFDMKRAKDSESTINNEWRSAESKYMSEWQ